MNIASHIEVFLSIILGIAVSDLAISFHRLMTTEHKVTWDWRLMLLAAFILLTLIEFWWGSFDWYTDHQSVSIAAFLPNVASMLVMFLTAAAVLPDEVPAEGIDLREHYWRRARYFWALNLLEFVVIFAFIAPRSIGPQTTLPSFIEQWRLNAIGMVLQVVLLLSRRERVHSVLIVAYVILFTQDFLFQVIG